MSGSETSGLRDPQTRAAIVGVAVIGILLAIGGAAGWGLRAGLSVEVGSLIAVANLYMLARIVGALLGARTDGEGNAAMWGLFAILKVVFLFGGVWALLASNLVAPAGLIVGWGALPIGVAAATLAGGGAGRDKTDRSIAPRAKEAPPAESSSSAAH